MSVTIRTEGLTKTFASTRAVHDLDLEIGGGQIFGFLGPNGAGKSTSIRMLLGLQHRTAGRASVFGLDAQRDAVKVHRGIGYLPGDLELIPGLTGRQHVEWFAHTRRCVEPALLGT